MRPCRQPGFTLLELMISITLTAVIVTLVAMALRTGLSAWHRLKETNKEILVENSLEGLLGRQLRAVVNRGVELDQFVSFEGSRHSISFVTRYAPMGAGAGGLFLVVYRWSEDKGLVYGQHLVTTPQDLRAELPDSVDPADMEDLEADGWKISLVPGMPPLNFAYRKDRNHGLDPEDWKHQWSRRQPLPQAVAVALGDEDGAQWFPFFLEPF